MSILQVSQIRVRRGLNEDLPQLAGGELAWSQDTRQLYIGNGLLEEGAPQLGRTEILTQFSIARLNSSIVLQLADITGNITILQGNVVAINNDISALQSATTKSTSYVIPVSSSGTILNTTANNGVISYSLTQGTTIRSGTIKYSASNAVVNYVEDYTQNGNSDTSFTLSANSTHTSLNYTTSTAATFLYRLNSLT